jgi:hypothetical protein
MAKILTAAEMADIVKRAGEEELFGSAQTREFLNAVADVVTEYFGADHHGFNYDAGDSLGWCCAFYMMPCVPNDGGVYAKYDTDITWKDGIEIED